MLLYFSVNITRNKKVFVLSILVFLIICSIPNNPGIISLKYREIPIPGLYKLVPNLQPYFQLKARITIVLSTFILCAAELKYCAGVQGYLRGVEA